MSEYRERKLKVTQIEIVRRIADGNYIRYRLEDGSSVIMPLPANAEFETASVLFYNTDDSREQE